MDSEIGARMTRRRRLSKNRLEKLKGKEQRTLILLGGVLAVLVIVMILKS